MRWLRTLRLRVGRWLAPLPPMPPPPIISMFAAEDFPSHWSQSPGTITDLVWCLFGTHPELRFLTVVEYPGEGRVAVFPFRARISQAARDLVEQRRPVGALIEYQDPV